ncbi:lectin-like domain-containing protein [Chitinophaga pinensis]|uniref:Legume lectin beta domain protein n=1 Tax=Chitinophaga pinensis (strain ATCC 43595 / DSM 2588 / LMG 13176 / NBRC 15968 / NCIMB 11800 / UQM 2034) TaxID=485918 RepID=A0A979GQR5_CHIPD|nr:PKD domain-containing protein [Chitinophaga pinensis]ACU57906.1 legume lectin beta domain protein [Chitinophaga pinensis DSM 2588]
MTRALLLIAGLCWLLFLSHTTVHAQLQTPYILNGAATQRTCNCYVLTEDQGTSSGTVWNKNKISLNNSFDYYFDVNLGCKDENGADGIGFILQTQGTNLGATGQGIGFQNIRPSLGVIIDTWQNMDDGDPYYDHVSIQINGDISHSSTNNLAGPVTALANNDNIEDCNWHIFHIKWNAATKQLEVSMDDSLRLSIQKDLVAEVFGGDPMVFWGFGAATGGASNKQQFCAALRPQLEFNSNQLFCDGSAIVFADNSKSFGSITRWRWDFGDGTTASVPDPPPHQYAKPGRYQVKLLIEDNSGCVSDTMKQDLTIGSYPIPDFSYDSLCTSRIVSITDKTTLDVGTLRQWVWDMGNGTIETTQTPVFSYDSTGTYTVRLQVTSSEGCGAEISKPVNVYPTPAIAAAGESVCIGEPVAFTGTDLTPSIPLSQWYWDMGNGQQQTVQNIDYIYPDGGEYEASLHTLSTKGCFSDTAYVPVTVSDIKLDLGNDTLIARGQPLQLQAVTGGNNLQFSWTPDNGLTDPYTANPTAILNNDQTYYLTVTSPQGCIDMDTIHIKVYAGPDFYVPTAFSPNNDGQNDIFRAISPGVATLDFFCVWNRWGQEVFRTQSLLTGWDGSYKGQQMPAGTYVWMIQGTDYRGNVFNRRGTVTIVR